MVVMVNKLIHGVDKLDLLETIIKILVQVCNTEVNFKVVLLKVINLPQMASTPPTYLSLISNRSFTNVTLKELVLTVQPKTLKLTFQANI